MNVPPVAVGIHPAAEIFPAIEGRALEDLVADIRTHGLREAITLHPDGRILDGRNRFRACSLASVEPTFRTWDGAGDPVAYVLSLNLHRRHLSESQRAIVGAKIANLQPGDNQHRHSGPANLPDLSQADAAELVNVSERSVRTAREVIDYGATEVVQAVERGDVAVSAAAQILDLPEETQAEIVALPEPERKAAIKAHVSQRRSVVVDNMDNGIKTVLTGRALRTREKKEAIRKLLIEGASSAVISAQLRVSRTSVSRIRSELGMSHGVKKTRTAVQERVETMREMASQGHTSRQIAAVLGVSHEGCRTRLRKEGIEVPGDRATSNHRRHNATRIIEHMVIDAENLTADVKLIDLGELDPKRFTEWLASLKASRGHLGEFIRQLIKEQKKHGETT